MTARSLTLLAPGGIPEIAPGDDLAALLCDALRADAIALEAGDILCIAQKIVSKAEGRLVRLDDVAPSPRAREIAGETGKDARFVEVVLSEARRVVRTGPNLLIVEDVRGFVMANAGIDRSNVDQGGGECVLLLPEDPDASAERLREAIRERTGVAPGLVIADSFGRPWRLGVTGFAVGAAGIPSLIDARGGFDRFGRRLEVTTIAYADEIAAAASLLSGEGAEGLPLVVLRGLGETAGETAPVRPASALLRPPQEDLFR